VTLRRRRHANERELVLAALGIVTVLCIGLYSVRELHYGAYGYRFLLWNLVLAWVPLVAALAFYDRYRRGAGFLRLLPWAALWLLFLPNAPYLVTDFVHLSQQPHTPLWFDGLLFAAFGVVGLLLGFASLYLVHAVVRHRFGPVRGWACVAASLALTSAGICLGRFLRWNSWDVLLRPGARLAQLTAKVSDPSAVVRATAVTLVLTGLLAAAYFSFYVLVGIRLDPDGTRRSPDA
jgi:uncharacterized membrane protein